MSMLQVQVRRTSLLTTQFSRSIRRLPLPFLLLLLLYLLQSCHFLRLIIGNLPIHCKPFSEHHHFNCDHWSTIVQYSCSNWNKLFILFRKHFDLQTAFSFFLLFVFTCCNFLYSPSLLLVCWRPECRRFIVVVNYYPSDDDILVVEWLLLCDFFVASTKAADWDCPVFLLAPHLHSVHAHMLYFVFGCCHCYKFS